MVFLGLVWCFGSPSVQEKSLVILIYFCEEMTNSSDYFLSLQIHLKTYDDFYVHLKTILPKNSDVWKLGASPTICRLVNFTGCFLLNS